MQWSLYIGLDAWARIWGFPLAIRLNVQPMSRSVEKRAVSRLP